MGHENENQMVTGLQYEESHTEEEQPFERDSASDDQECEFCFGEMNRDCCGAESLVCEDGEPQWCCTRRPGHEGQHVACGARHDIHRWTAINSERECDNWPYSYDEPRDPEREALNDALVDIASTNLHGTKPLPLDEKIRDLIHEIKEKDEVRSYEVLKVLNECLLMVEKVKDHTKSIASLGDDVKEAKRKVESLSYQGEQA